MRRYDMDWLRVLVFGLLIFYHVGMFFVPWGWHIKNPTTYDRIKYPMLFVNQWRLPILFVISGMGTYFALNKRSGAKFIRERFSRLLIPLAIGMFLIVPPQVYIERVVNGQFSGSYLDYWPGLAFQGIYPEGNLSWHHLWFLPYLLLYSVLLAPVFLYLRKNPANLLITWLKARLLKPMGLYWAILPLYLTEAFLEPFFPVTHALVGDWFALTNFLILFFFGFLLMTVRKEFWSIAENNRRTYLALGVSGFAALMGLWMLFDDSTIIHFTEAGLKVFNLWTWIIVLFGYASHYLNKPSRALSYANEAVYPFYILHQTITILIGYFLLKVEMNFMPAFIIMTLGTFLLSALVYEVCIRPWPWMRPLFGLKTRSPAKAGVLPASS
jgi:hypothetical protein